MSKKVNQSVNEILLDAIEANIEGTEESCPEGIREVLLAAAKASQATWDENVDPLQVVDSVTTTEARLNPPYYKGDSH